MRWLVPAWPGPCPAQQGVELVVRPGEGTVLDEQGQVHQAQDEQARQAGQASGQVITPRTRLTDSHPVAFNEPCRTAAARTDPDFSLT